MKNTILSENDAKLIEKAIIQYGRILSVQNLAAIFKELYTDASAHNRINQLVHAGWLRRIKQGLYLIVDSLSARSQNDMSLYVIANSLVSESYVSLSYALNYYQMFDQYDKVITSVTVKNSKKYDFDGHTYNFSKVKKDLYFGFIEKRENSKIINIAEAEKALIDYLYLDQSFSSASLVFEKIRDHHSELDVNTLQAYAIRSGSTVLRKVGFILDTLNLNSDQASNALKNNYGSSHFTADSKLFNAKWRLYYDTRIIG
jgi:predicted transcriptional regulator of viral defense system